MLGYITLGFLFAGSGNYTGTYYTFITIQKANLTVTVAPTLNIGVSSIAYGSEMSYVNSSINQNSAEIKWQKHGSSAPAELMQHGIANGRYIKILAIMV